MHNTIKALLIVAAVVLIAATTASAQSNTGNTTLQVGVAAEAALTVNTSTTQLTTTGTVFNDYTGATSFTYKVRTTKSGGSGTVTASIASDFAGAASGVGPKIASSDLKYTSATTGVGTGNPSAVTALVGTATNVLTFGENTRSTQPGDSGAVNWTLVNNPQYETDTYTTTVVLTISAT
jgi:hypothetical protein